MAGVSSFRSPRTEKPKGDSIMARLYVATCTNTTEARSRLFKQSARRQLRTSDRSPQVQRFAFVEMGSEAEPKATADPMQELGIRPLKVNEANPEERPIKHSRHFIPRERRRGRRAQKRIGQPQCLGSLDAFTHDRIIIRQQIASRW